MYNEHKQKRRFYQFKEPLDYQSWEGERVTFTTSSNLMILNFDFILRMTESMTQKVTEMKQSLTENMRHRSGLKFGDVKVELKHHLP